MSACSRDRFPEEKAGIEGLVADMQGLAADIGRYSAAGGKIDMTRFAQDYPVLAKTFGKTWGAMVDARIMNPKLRAVFSSLWGYYGLPPSKLSPYYYALPTIGYIEQGGYYPKGGSQKISDAFAKRIKDGGGEVLLGTRVSKILVKDGAAVGVRTEDGREFGARVVVSNANAPDTFGKMLDEPDLAKATLARMEKLSMSLGAFQVFLGLKKDLVGKLGLEDTEIFYNTGYDIEADYGSAVRGDFANPGLRGHVYDNLYKGYSPAGKNTLSIMTLQGFDPWEKYAADYFAGKKDAYRAEKERMADVLIDQAEKSAPAGPAQGHRDQGGGDAADEHPLYREPARGRLRLGPDARQLRPVPLPAKDARQEPLSLRAPGRRRATATAPSSRAA